MQKTSCEEELLGQKVVKNNHFTPITLQMSASSAPCTPTPPQINPTSPTPKIRPPHGELRKCLDFGFGYTISLQPPPESVILMKKTFTDTTPCTARLPSRF